MPQSDASALERSFQKAHAWVDELARHVTQGEIDTIREQLPAEPAPEAGEERTAR